MKIAHVEAINLLFEYPGRAGFQYAGGVCTSRVTTLVLVHTECGQTGIGSVYSHPGLVYLVINEQLAPLLSGEDATDIERIWHKMYGITRWYGRKGAAMTALGGIDTALWDLKGKKEGKPVWKLLGGEQSSCPAYASGLLWSSIDELVSEAESHLEAGYRRMKMRLARSEEFDVEAVRSVKNAIGVDNDLMVDASMRYSLEVAKRMGNHFTEEGVFWYEEPFAPEDIDSFVALRGEVDVPLAVGENEFGLQGFRELIRAGAVDIVQPDVSRCGGISEVIKVCKLAQKHGLRAATHTWSDAAAIIANAHVISAMPNGITVEVDRTDNPFVKELLTEPLQIADGQLALSSKPGLGIELNMDVVEKHRMADPLKMPEGSYSDMMFGKEYFPKTMPFEEAGA
jgi:L-alanine-DL-glutamate epimerase-like enolase superfamily enzyme